MDSIEAAELALSLRVGRRAAEAMPTLPASLRANRMLLGHMVRRLVSELGITQLLGLGSGVPTVGNVHEVAPLLARLHDESAQCPNASHIDHSTLSRITSP